MEIQNLHNNAFAVAYYALFTRLVFAAFVLLLKRLVAAWKKRNRNAIG